MFPPTARSADSVPKNETQATAAKTYPEEIPAQLRETARGVETGGKEKAPNEILGKAAEKAIPASESPAGKSSDSMEGPGLRADVSTAARSADSVPKNETQATAAKTYPEEITPQLRETARGVETDGKEKTPNEILGKTAEKAIPASESTAGKSSDSMEGPGLRADVSTAARSADSVPKNETRATAAKTYPEEMPAQLRETSRGVATGGKEKAPNGILGKTAEKAVPASESTAGKPSDSVEGSGLRANVSTAARSADSVPKNETQATAAKTYPEEITPQLRETARGVETDQKEKTPNEILGKAAEKSIPASESPAGKSSDSMEGPGLRANVSTAARSADSVPKNETQATAAKTDPEVITPQLRETARGVETDGKEKTPSEVFGKTAEKAVQAAESTAGKSSDSVEGSGLRANVSTAARSADSVPKNERQAVAAKTYPEEITPQLRETARGVATGGKEKTPNEILGKTAEKAIPASESTAGKSSDSVEGSGLKADVSTAAQSADSVPKNETQATAAKTYPEEITPQLRETARGVETDGKEKTPSEVFGKTAEKAVPATESTAGKSSDLVEGSGLRANVSTVARSADSVPKNERQAVAAKTSPKEIPPQLRETSRGVETDGKEKTPNEILGKTADKAIPAD